MSFQYPMVRGQGEKKNPTKTHKTTTTTEKNQQKQAFTYQWEGTHDNALSAGMPAWTSLSVLVLFFLTRVFDFYKTFR